MTGSCVAGQTLTEAWQSADGRWIIGTGIANFQLAPHAYLITLDAQRGYNPADDGTAFRFANMPTIHPAFAVTPANTSFLTAIETSPSITPTHVFATTTVTDRGPLNRDHPVALARRADEDEPVARVATAIADQMPPNAARSLPQGAVSWRP